MNSLVHLLILPTTSRYITLLKHYKAEDIPYFATRAVRGASVFESIDYLEIRFNPYKRTPRGLPEAERLALMRDVAAQVIRAGQATEFPIASTYILCMDRGFSVELNRAIVHVAAELPEVTAVDLAGPYAEGGPTWNEWRDLFAEAKSLGLKTTAHMAESDRNDIHPALFPYLDRIGHGIQIAPASSPASSRTCPASYLPGNLPNYLPAYQHNTRFSGTCSCFCPVRIRRCACQHCHR